MWRIGYTISAARDRDIGALAAIELAAARLLVGHAPESVLAETTSQSALERARRDGHLWVVRADDEPVGFALVATIDARTVHLEEIAVHPEHGRRGLGTNLVMHVCAWAAAAAYEWVSLTTFREVPWNMPFYARLGFEVVPDAAFGPRLRAIVEDERRRGLDPSRRVVMRRACHA